MRLLWTEPRCCAPYGSINWGAICAAATVMTLPVVVLALLVQRHIVEGLAGGSIKG